MRRIIERVVTVVTTTTWKISWEADPPNSDSEVDPVSSDLPTPYVLAEIAQSPQSHSLENIIKEADLQELNTETDQKADEPPKNS